MDFDLRAFLKERDEVLMSLDVDRVMAFHAKHNPGSDVHNDREAAEVGMHKARTACLSLPREARMLSKRWLSERGYKSMDDGDLTDG